MKKIFLFLFLPALLVAQEKSTTVSPKQTGKYDTNKFSQMYDLLATPNLFRTASGAPGPAYYQQQADYKINIDLDDKNSKLTGSETITYYNNSPDTLEYLWVQLDQNQSAKNSQTPLAESQRMEQVFPAGNFTNKFLKQELERGFNIDFVKDAKGNPLSFTINQTMMRINLETPMKPGEKFSFAINWWYNINNYRAEGGRSGYELFEKSGNKLYVIAQFYPRMAVYNDVEGWQNMQFWGTGEFTLPFGDFDVNITVPADHIMEATGDLMNRSEVFTAAQLKRYELAQKTYDKPVVVVTQAEAEASEKGFSDKKKTWKFSAKNVRDFGIATSRKFIYDAMAVKLNDKTVMAISVYPKESNPLWGETATRTVAHTLKSYSAHTFDYPYPKAVSVSAEDQGMEYPMICWNYGRPDEKGVTSDRIKNGMIGVTIHEVGHNFFPMIVNSDERQWSWMDEGLNTFMQYMAEQEMGTNFPSSRGPASKIVPYMSGDQKFLEPIMSNSETIVQFGANAYGKPATGLNILRETIMGRELFDHAFKVYANRWKFKHPTPEDFFRTMEDASAVDLDWFFRGWFYSTDFVDIGIKEVKQYYVSLTPTKDLKDATVRRGRFGQEKGPFLYLVPETSEELSAKDKKALAIADVNLLSEYVNQNFTADEKAKLKSPKYFYEVDFNKPGGMLMPIIVELTYEDDTKETFKYPAQIWRKNNDTAKKVYATEKAIKKIQIDPKLETADIDVTNNTWPKEEVKSKFD
ncbi:M1 family peptidase [Flavobacterium sp. GSP27]|uniref:M1 family metallopeptidase n=1 Tax=unclassified Flavobacterium TaxID=196869 RepID=UPI000F818CF2|nr:MULTISPECIES: M1 family metallopeptidase [unclassified Flavobacterium]RTY95536.1 M1 family peptidase [Flavobacterium sp. GSN2]RTY76800.1 M1 family peptidase [Flavobacterium sp. LS1R10]RTY83211.1 M1 family peptidase [Flavobacterium sp. ZB4P23]RTY84334.1 M1 family peptidase [Flavobacterium sp. LS1P28]RTZ09509.1 M1 family peptidase [Flavobacterium sp. GSP27]